MNLTQYTVNNFDNITNITPIKFKGRKSNNVHESTTFDPNQYVILFKDHDKYYSIAIDPDTGEQYKIIYDSSLTIIDNHFEVQYSDVNSNNETFTIKSTNKL